MAETSTEPMVEKICAGLYRIIGITCGIISPQGVPCGGELRIELCDGSERDFRWETFCDRCKNCDCNGWPTRSSALANAKEYFNSVPAAL
jgi:hypothetical protein